MAKKVKTAPLPETKAETVNEKEKKLKKSVVKKKEPIHKPKKKPEVKEEEFEDLIELQPNFDEFNEKVWSEKNHEYTINENKRRNDFGRHGFAKGKKTGFKKNNNNPWSKPKSLVWRDGSTSSDNIQHKNSNGKNFQGKNKPFRKDNRFGSENSFSKDNNFGKDNSHRKENTFGKTGTFRKDNNFGKDKPYNKENSFGKDKPYNKENSFGKENFTGNKNFGKDRMKFKKKKDNRSWEERKPKFWNEGKSKKF